MTTAALESGYHPIHEFTDNDVIPSNFIREALKTARPIASLYFGEGLVTAKVLSCHRMDALHYRLRLVLLETSAGLFDDPAGDCRATEPPIVIGDEMFSSARKQELGDVYAAALLRDSTGEMVEDMVVHFKNGNTLIEALAETNGMRLDIRNLTIKTNDGKLGSQ